MARGRNRGSASERGHMVPTSSSVNSRLSPCSFVSGFFTTLYSTCICKCIDFRVLSVHYEGKGKGYSQKVVREGVIRGRGLSSLFRQPQKANRDALSRRISQHGFDKQHFSDQLLLTSHKCTCVDSNTVTY